MQQPWWDRWPQAQRAPPNDSWALNYNLYWGRSVGPTNGSIIVHSRRTEEYASLVYVFSQYHTLCDRISAHRQSLKQMRGVNPSNMVADHPVVILGTPGIGKSIFLYYYAIRLMRDETPFIVYSGDQYHLITPNGVRVASSTAVPGIVELQPLFPAATNTPFLIDVDGPELLPRLTILMQAPFFYVQAASLKLENYKWAGQYNFNTKFVMNPPTVDETLELLRYVAPDVRPRKARYTVEAFGPGIRNILNALRPGANPLAALRTAVKNLEDSDLQALTKAATSLQTHALVKTICPNEPVPDGPGWTGPDDMEHVVANPTALHLIMARWASDERRSTLRILKRLSNIPQTASSAGWLFESWAHARLCEAGTLTLHQMLLRRGKYKVDEASAPVQQVTLPALQSATYLRINEAKESATYYIPAATNNPTFDSFFRLANGDTYAFQMTLAKTHTLKEPGLKLLNTRMGKSRSNNFVFVVPAGRTFSFTPPETIPIRDLRFWLMYIDLDESARSVVEGSYEHWDEHERLEDQDNINEI